MPKRTWSQVTPALPSFHLTSQNAANMIATMAVILADSPNRLTAIDPGFGPTCSIALVGTSVLGCWKDFSFKSIA